MDLFDGNRVAAYFLWEYTHCSNALHLWLCAEDIGLFLKQHSMTESSKIEAILKLGTTDIEYVGFTRHVAFRVYKYTGCEDCGKNWFAAERLMNNSEWREAVCAMAREYVKKDSL